MTLTAPTAPADVVAVIVVAFTNVKLAATPPKVTLVAPVKVVPVMVTTVPPAGEPESGLTEVTVGSGLYVYSVLAGVVPTGVVTMTLAAPAAPAGVVAVIVVAFTTATPVAAAPPKVTPVAPVKVVPVMVTLVPPAVGPEFGLTEVTVGPGM